MASQAQASATNPWVWDENAGQYRRYDHAQRRWIYQNEDDAEDLMPESEAIRHRQSSSGGHRRRRTTLVSSNDSAVSGVLAGMEDMTLGAPDSGRGQNLDAQDETVVRGKVFRRVHKSVFVPGFVFQCILNQEAGPSESPGARSTTTNNHAGDVFNIHEQRIHSEVRMFVVLKDNHDWSSSCLSVQTYRGRGVAKRGLRKHLFSIIFSSNQAPGPQSDELPGRGEYSMRPPVRVNVTKRYNHLDPMSRLNLRAVHCVQQNWKIYPIGRVAQESWSMLLQEHHLASNDSEGHGRPQREQMRARELAMDNSEDVFLPPPGASFEADIPLPYHSGYASGPSFPSGGYGGAY